MPTSVTAACKFTGTSLPDSPDLLFNVMGFVRDPELYAKGAVRHPDHGTIDLASWHRVFRNT